MDDVKWAGAFSGKERQAVEGAVKAVAIDESSVRMVMKCLGPQSNILLAAWDELIAIFVPWRRKHRSEVPAISDRYRFENIAQVAYKTRGTRDSDVAPRRLYVLGRDESVTELGLLLAANGLLENLAAALAPIPLVVDGKVLQVNQEPTGSAPMEGLFDRSIKATPPIQEVAVNADQLKLFISHASEDGKAAVSVTAEFESHGIATWLATRDIHVGTNYAEQIYEAVLESSHVVVLLSSESVSSQHVQREVNLAIDKQKPLLPIVVSDTGDLMASLPAAWKYWLGVVQVVPYSGPGTAIPMLIKSIEK